MLQRSLFPGVRLPEVKPFRTQLLKWIGNKQRFANEIVSYFPDTYEKYYEPFLGSGAVLGTLAPSHAIASDVFQPLVEIWQTLKNRPGELKQWYQDRWMSLKLESKEAVYERTKASYNRKPNGPDLLFLCRSCYGGVVRFRKADGFMSTPCGVHQPISPLSFSKRVDLWHARCRRVEFRTCDYSEAMSEAKNGDFIYCDPPYSDTQSILYGAQGFRLERLYETIEDCKARGVNVALSIDGSKQSGRKICEIKMPRNLFETEVEVNCGRSMLRRFQLPGQTLEREIVADRLLLTYTPKR